MTSDEELPHPYDVILAPSAKRALSEKLPSSAAFAAMEFIAGPLAEKPTVVGAPLRAPFEGLWRALRGEYRIRYRLDRERRIVTVLDVSHRRDAYRS